MIERIETAVAAYPWSHQYRLWPGPNSNTFVAYVARAVPELGLDLPPTAIGKDYLGVTTWLAKAPSGTGWQISLAGLAGITVARDHEHARGSVAGGARLPERTLRRRRAPNNAASNRRP